MIDAAKEQEKEALKELWRLCFGDSQAFINFYFAQRFQPEKTLVYREHDTPIASAQISPFYMLARGETVKSTYILGVATHPDHRRKGLFKQLMREAIKQQYVQSICFTTLIPQFPYLFSIYKQFGFSELFDLKEAKFKKENIPAQTNCHVICWEKEQFRENVSKPLYAFYTAAYENMAYTLLKSYDDFIFTIKEFLFFEGSIYISFDKKDGKINGCGFFQIESHALKEFLFQDETAKNAILSTIARDAETDEITAYLPTNTTDDGIINTIGMARIIHVGSALQLLARRNENPYSIFVHDDIIEENNGIYRIGQNTVVKQSGGSADFEISIGKLTSLMLERDICVKSGVHAIQPDSYMNLMLNE